MLHKPLVVVLYRLISTMFTLSHNISPYMLTVERIKIAGEITAAMPDGSGRGPGPEISLRCKADVWSVRTIMRIPAFMFLLSFCALV